jgi:PadR family transcriptional regulator AphA
MSIQAAMLGLLSWTPLSGYDIKKIFAESETLYWSGNNNQIYRTLVQLHNENLVTQEVEYQEDNPPRKVYTITDKGLAQLREWVRSTPGLPQVRHEFLIQLAWADLLDADALDHLLSQYEDEVRVHLLMLREQAQRDPPAPDRSPRERYLWRMIHENTVSFYENELNWVRTVRQGVHEYDR